jgi:O-Antigen ligase
MEIDPSVTYRSNENVPALKVGKKRSDALLFIVIFVTVCILTPLLALVGSTISVSLVLGCLLVLIVAVLTTIWPMFGFYVVLGCIVLVESRPNYFPIFTDQLTIYYWPSGLEGLIERPIGFFILFVIFVFICHRLINHQRILQGGPLLLPFFFFLLCVAFGMLHGLATGGDFKTIVLEIRPFWYLFVSYLLAYNFVTRESHIRTFFWIVILAAGIKGLQGVYIYLIVLHGDLSNAHEIMTHEESFFFVALILLIVLFRLHYRYRPQLYAALVVLPFVLAALVANQRRADYIALIVGLAVAWMLILKVKPRARKGLFIGGLICVMLGVSYVVIFSQVSGPLGQPARSVVSVFQPGALDSVDAASNQYRINEDFDLKYTEKQDPLLGYGFGKKFLEPMPLVDISSDDPIYLFVPHNTIYWVWMRLGPIGYFALWYLFGAIIVRGCLILRQLRNTYLQLVAIYIIALTFMEIVVAFADYQLFFYRNVLYIGLLVGILMKLPAIDEKNKKKEQSDHESTHGVPEYSISNSRS